jgi:hypothetical protein
MYIKINWNFYLFSRYDQFLHCQYYTNGKAIVLSFQKEIGKVYVIKGTSYLLFSYNVPIPLQFQTTMVATNYNHLHLTCSLDWWIFF